ncbi:MAG: hypothetical protein Q8P41_17540 [Pseudomonadota bacterium]|nr:hypothetical protein [Pseudomonadota bacterium]
MTLLLLLACAGADDTAEPLKPDPGALGAGPLNPFPSVELVGTDGHLAIPAGLLPQVPDGTAMDVRRLNWREGFSRVQTSVAMLPAAVDPESLPGPGAIGIGGSVRMFDLDTGAEIPMFAELDAHPDAVATGARALLVRPMLAMTPGHQVAVVVTDAVTSGGAPLSVLAWSAAKQADPHYQDLSDTLAGLGVDNVAVAWDFPVGDGTAVMRDLAAKVTTPAAYTFDRVDDADDGGLLPPGVWKKIEGSFPVDNWLVDDLVFDVDDAGLPIANGSAEATLYIHVPDAARTMAPGTAPVIVFGHGILSNPGNYLDEDDDPSALVELSNRLGAIVVATTWRGLTSADQVDTVQMAADFGRFPELTDRLAQAVANNLQLIRLVDEGTLLDDPALGGLADRSRLYWYGISLGSIEGAVTLANQSRIEHAVLHVGGSAWSTMLERSSNWPTFEVLVERGILDPWERQVLYATSQLLWDPVDPASYVEELAGRSFLWQESIGDDQVPNLTTELLMRSVGVALGTPGVTTPYDVDDIALPTAGPVLTQFDPGRGMPADSNRPAEFTGAHGEPRLWEGTKAQTLAFFAAGAEGTVTHFCGSAPCTADNQGE